LVAALFAANAGAQTNQHILWLFTEPALGATDVRLDGTLVVARNLHAAGPVQSPTVNGVTFTGGFAPTGWTNASTGALNGSTTGDAGYDLLLDSARATSAAVTANPTGWGGIRLDDLPGLTLGHTYQIQCWYTEQRAGAGTAALYDRNMVIGCAVGPATLVGGEVTNLGSLVQGTWMGSLEGDPDNYPALGSPDTQFGSHCTGWFSLVSTDQLWLLVQGTHPLNNLRSHLTAFQIRDVSAVNQDLGVGCGSPPMTLSAAPAPVINPSTSVTYALANVPEFLPGSGVYLSTLFLSITPLPGIPLQGILTTQPGCSAYIATLSDLGPQVTFTPTASWVFTFDSVHFLPGDIIGAQAVALFDPSFPLPNGESGGILTSNGVFTICQTQ